jgi:hypothetical protein
MDEQTHKTVFANVIYRLDSQFQPGGLFFKRSIPQRHILDPDDLTAHRIFLKLQDRCTGPHVVIRQRSPVTYRCSVMVDSGSSPQ